MIDLDEARVLPDAIAHWEQNDRLRTVAVETRRSFRVT